MQLVRHCKDSFVELLKSGCLDLLFANQEEAVALADVLQLTKAEGVCFMYGSHCIDNGVI